MFTITYFNYIFTLCCSLVGHQKKKFNTLYFAHNPYLYTIPTYIIQNVVNHEYGIFDLFDPSDTPY